MDGPAWSDSHHLAACGAISLVVIRSKDRTQGSWYRFSWRGSWRGDVSVFPQSTVVFGALASPGFECCRWMYISAGTRPFYAYFRTECWPAGGRGRAVDASSCRWLCRDRCRGFLVPPAKLVHHHAGDRISEHGFDLCDSKTADSASRLTRKSRSNSAIPLESPWLAPRFVSNDLDMGRTVPRSSMPAEALSIPMKRVWYKFHQGACDSKRE